MKKGVLAVLSVFVAWSAMDYLIHGVILASSYAATPTLWRPMAEMKGYLLHLTTFISSLGFVLIYSLFVSKRGVSTGLEFGLLYGLATGVPMGYGSYSVMPIPYMMAFTWCFGTVVEASVAGLIVGAISSDERRFATV